MIRIDNRTAEFTPSEMATLHVFGQLLDHVENEGHGHDPVRAVHLLSLTPVAPFGADLQEWMTGQPVVSVDKAPTVTLRKRPTLTRLTMPGIHQRHRLMVSLGNARRPLLASIVQAPLTCDRCGQATVSVNLGYRDCPSRCRRSA